MMGDGHPAKCDCCGHRRASAHVHSWLSGAPPIDGSRRRHRHGTIEVLAVLCADCALRIRQAPGTLRLVRAYADPPDPDMEDRQPEG